jgi:stromal membrane-associated protein
MQIMGNSKGRAVYECNLPENYRRSQTDSAMEQFIRGKYEARKWMSKDWVPPTISTADLMIDDDKSKSSSGVSTNKIKLKTNSNVFNINQSPTSTSSKPSKQEQKSPNSTTVYKDPVLLDFEFHSSVNSTASTTTSNTVKKEEIDFFKTTTDNSTTPNLFENFDGLTFDHQSSQIKSPELISPTPITTQSSSNPTNELEQINFNVNLDNNKSKIDKQSILALYNNGVPRASSMQSFTNTNTNTQQQQQQQQLFNQQNKMPFNNQSSTVGASSGGGVGGLINLDQTFLKPQHSQQFQNSFQVNNVCYNSVLL